MVASTGWMDLGFKVMGFISIRWVSFAVGGIVNLSSFTEGFGGTGARGLFCSNVFKSCVILNFALFMVAKH